MNTLIIAKPDLSRPRQSGAEEAAAALLASIPTSATAIALAMHERAAWGYDRALEAHWAEVLRLVNLATCRPSLCVESRSEAVSARSYGTNKAAAAVGRSSQRKDHPWTISSGAPGLRLALFALASLAAIVLPSAPRAAQLDPEEGMVEEFQSICADYYSHAQCCGAIRFVLKTYGSDYLVQLRYEEAPSRFAEMLSAAVKGGETLKAGEIAAAGAGD